MLGTRWQERRLRRGKILIKSTSILRQNILFETFHAELFGSLCHVIYGTSRVDVDVDPDGSAVGNRYQ